MGAGALDRACVGAGALGVTGVVMRVKSSMTFMRFRRGAPDAHYAHMTYRLQVDTLLPRLRAIGKAAVLATIVAATGWAMATAAVTTAAVTTAAVTSSADAFRANQANQNGDDSRDCSSRYAALLDLAELARRGGKSSGVVVRGLSDQHGAMSECLPMSLPTVPMNLPMNLPIARGDVARPSSFNPAALERASNHIPEKSPQGSG